MRALLQHPEVKRFLAQHKTLTQQSYRQSLRIVCAVLRIKSLPDLQRTKGADVMRARDTLARTRKPASVARDMAVARSLCRYLRAYGVLKNNPFWGLPPVKIGDNVPHWNVVSQEQATRLLAAAAKSKHGPRDYTAMICLLRHGWRVSELCSMRWEQLELEDGRMVVTFVGKGGKIARMALKQDALAAIHAYWGATKPKATDPLVPRFIGGPPLTRQEIYKVVVGCSRQAGVRVTPHGLRASFITDVTERKGIAVARKLARHSSISTTQRYDRREILDDADVPDLEKP